MTYGACAHMCCQQLIIHTDLVEWTLTLRCFWWRYVGVELYTLWWNNIQINPLNEKILLTLTSAVLQFLLTTRTIFEDTLICNGSKSISLNHPPTIKSLMWDQSLDSYKLAIVLTQMPGHWNCHIYSQKSNFTLHCWTFSSLNARFNFGNVLFFPPIAQIPFSVKYNTNMAKTHTQSASYKCGLQGHCVIRDYGLPMSFSLWPQMLFLFSNFLLIVTFSQNYIWTLSRPAPHFYFHVYSETCCRSY